MTFTLTYGGSSTPGVGLKPARLCLPSSILTQISLEAAGLQDTSEEPFCEGESSRSPRGLVEFVPPLQPAFSLVVYVYVQS